MKPNVGELVFCSGKYCIIIFAFNVSFAFITVLINALVFVALVRIAKRQTWKTSSVIYCNLIIADFLTGLICQPLHGYFILKNKNVYNEKDLSLLEAWLFFLLNYTSYTLCCSSLLTVAFMSLERLMAIAFSLRHRNISTISRTVTVLAVLTLFSAVVPLFRFISSKTEIVFMVLLVLVVITSLVTVVVAYLMLFRSFKKQRITTANLTSMEKAKARGLQQERRLAKSFALITFILIIMYLPQLLLKPISIATDMKKNSASSALLVILEDSFNTLLYCNSAVNIFVYFARHGEVKKELQAIFCCSPNNQQNTKSRPGSLPNPSTNQTVTRV